jgi:hypothetical protein
MRAVAGSILVLATALVIASVRLASKMIGRPDADEAAVNLALVVGAFVLGGIGLGIVVTGLAAERHPLPPRPTP